jgi:hypothetical protein
MGILFCCNFATIFQLYDINVFVGAFDVMTSFVVIIVTTPTCFCGIGGFKCCWLPLMFLVLMMFWVTKCLGLFLLAVIVCESFED